MVKKKHTYHIWRWIDKCWKGVGGWPLGEKREYLRIYDEDNEEIFDLEEPIELHRLVVEDFTQLQRRAEEINEAVLDATCATEDEAEEVSTVPNSLRELRSLK